jgi:uncharacterized phage protein gp47/JayE
MLSSVDDKYDKTPGSFFDDALNPAAIEFENQGTELVNVKLKLNVENLSGLELERFINQRTGINRKQATKASAEVTIYGSESASIKVGDLVASEVVNYVVKDNKTIGPSKEAAVLVECEIPGSIGNVPIGAIKYFPITIAGLTGVVNVGPVTNGYESESDEELRNRYYDKIQTPATSGNKHHYLNWAKEIVGAGDARVISLWNGNNTVKVVIIDANKQPASAELVLEVQNHIDPNITGLGDGVAPIGAFCTVISAISKDINITFTVTRDINFNLEEVKIDVKNNISNYLKAIAFKESIVSHAILGATILGSKGVLDYSLLKINTGVSNINIGNEEVAILGTVVINE